MSGPLTYLDFAVLAVCFISGLLAMYRGFARELLSIVSWIAADGRGCADAACGKARSAVSPSADKARPRGALRMVGVIASPPVSRTGCR